MTMTDLQVDYTVARDFINTLLPPLKPTDSVQKALNWMNELRVHQLAVVSDEGSYLGMLNEEMLYDSNDYEALVGDFPFQYKNIYISEYQHFYEVINKASKYSLHTIAVLDEFGKYIGVISVNDTASVLARSYATQETGGILVLSMRDYDYSMTEISRLVESEGVKILSSYIEPDAYDRSMIKLTIKLNRIDLTRVIATLERFDYHVVASFHESERIDITKERLDMLMRYLEV
jgi:acetoin utilization protein AcuB